MNWSNILTVFGKELRDMLRDRRTLMSMIVVPAILIPGLMLSTVTIVKKVITKAKATAPTVMIVGGADSPGVLEALRAHPKLQIVPPADDWRTRIAEKRIRVAVEVPPGFDASLAQGVPVQVKLYHYEGEVRSGIGLGEVREFFRNYREQVITARLTKHGLGAEVVKPFEVITQNVAPPEKVGGNLFGGMIPYFFLLLSFAGAMYPAMDLTAGEKERGTMETILCSPVRRIDLVLGKFLMVLVASLGTVACSVISSLATLAIGGSLLGGKAAAASAGASAPFGGTMPTLDPLGLIAVVTMVIPMAVLFAAVQFTIALFAKSYKEAQSYVSPLIIVIIVPAVIAMLPGVELNSRLALVPILNVALVSKELVSGVWNWDLILLIFGSTCLYAAAALGLAVRMFNREDVLFRA